MAAPAWLPGGTTNRGRFGQTDLARRPGFGPGGELRQGGRVLDAGRRRPDHGATPPPVPDRDRPGLFRMDLGHTNEGFRILAVGVATTVLLELRRPRLVELKLTKDPAYADRVIALLEAGWQHVRCGSKATPASAKSRSRWCPDRRSRWTLTTRSGRRRVPSGSGIWRGSSRLLGDPDLPPISGDGFFPAIGPGVARVERRDHAAGMDTESYVAQNESWSDLDGFHAMIVSALAWETRRSFVERREQERERTKTTGNSPGTPCTG